MQLFNTDPRWFSFTLTFVIVFLTLFLALSLVEGSTMILFRQDITEVFIKSSVIFDDT